MKHLEDQFHKQINQYLTILQSQKRINMYQQKDKNFSKQETELLNKKFNRLFVICTLYENDKRKKFYLCRCDCGNFCVVEGYKIKVGHTQSCGCLQKEKSTEILKAVNKNNHNLTHTNLYSRWASMKRRCYNKNQKDYKNYGGRGIKICKEWLNSPQNFYYWAIKNGYKPELEIDRIDVDGNYEPNNCRWVTHTEQCNNKRIHKYKHNRLRRRVA